MKHLPFAVLLILFSCGSSGGDSSPATTAPAVAPETTVRFLWREPRFDEVFQDTVSVLVLDEEYCKTIPDAERAALGYVATFIGNECEWDGDYTEDRSNLKCKILTALDLGYQCSEQHLGFLRKWFSTDNKVLIALTPENCPTTPDGASVAETFDEITLTTKDNYIIVSYKVSGYDMRAAEIWTRDATMYFQHYEGGIQLVDGKKSEPVHKPMYEEQ